jgi:hypothetical protein
VYLLYGYLCKSLVRLYCNKWISGRIRRLCETARCTPQEYVFSRVFSPQILAVFFLSLLFLVLLFLFSAVIGLV